MSWLYPLLRYPAHDPPSLSCSESQPSDRRSIKPISLPPPNEGTLQRIPHMFQWHRNRRRVPSTPGAKEPAHRRVRRRRGLPPLHARSISQHRPRREHLTSLQPGFCTVHHDVGSWPTALPSAENEGMQRFDPLPPPVAGSRHPPDTSFGSGQPAAAIQPTIK
jgi:hypothetical protein